MLQVKINELNSACRRLWRVLRRTMESFGWRSRVSIVLRDLNSRPQAVLFHRLIPSVFHKTLSKYTPNNSFKMHFSIWAGPIPFTFWSAIFQIKISTLDSLHNSCLHFYFKIYSLKDISNFRYSNNKNITLI